MDRDLVVRAQHGDARAFEALALGSHARLQTVAVGILGDPHLAEDATQEALVAIWRDIRRLRDPAKFEGWSYRLLVRICYAEAKRRPTVLPQPFAGRPDEPVAVDAYAAVIHRDQLDHAFERLSIDHRAVVVLHHVMDMTLEQVAEALDIPMGTVSSRMNRAMSALRGALEADARPASAFEVPQEVVP